MRSRAPVPCKLFNKSWAVFSLISDQKWKLKRSIWWHMVEKKVDGSYFNMFSTFYKKIAIFAKIYSHDMTLCPWPSRNHCSNMGITKKLVAFIKHLSILLLITRKGDREHSSSQRSKFGKSIQCNQNTSNQNRRCRKMRQKVINNKFASNSTKEKKTTNDHLMLILSPLWYSDVHIFTYDSLLFAYSRWIWTPLLLLSRYYLINDLLL